ncbi:MAG TPA: serine/threonine protein kinase [Arenimonas sp.]|uniref:serine/threonine protein kinase n=1 Tax=Arenimonas sp. TaxID=1872635 RepID=UPI002CEE7177|nr:serine/threonine protein kinase [Arenimonas sp.]HMB56204.1 serine/threonine protein kinase [Arenimonas sp.]
MSDLPAAPFAGLDPDRIIAAIESVGVICDGRVLALNSYENRVYRVGCEDAPALVAKFYRPDRWSDAAIIEEHEFAAQLRAADLSVVAPLRIHERTLHDADGFRFALFPMQGGHAPEPGDRDTLRQIGRTLGRMHAVGASETFAHRTTQSIELQAIAPVRYLLEAGWLPPSLEANFEAIANLLIDEIEDAWERAGSVALLRLHGDCHPGNILWRDDAAHFVDLDDCLTGPAMQDLWMLISGDREAQRTQLEWLLEGYEIFRPFDRRELHLIEALRAMRLLHYHAWIARRWHDPAFPAAFPWFESPRHWEGVITQVQEQLAILREPPLSLS